MFEMIARTSHRNYYEYRITSNTNVLSEISEYRDAGNCTAWALAGIEVSDDGYELQ